jgi:hypothetical protein
MFVLLSDFLSYTITYDKEGVSKMRNGGVSFDGILES